MPQMSETLHRLSTSSVYRAVAGRVVLPWALRGLRPSGRGLEIGCGSGAMAARLLTRFADLQLVATDFGPQMVTSAGERLRPFGERAVVGQADATQLPFEDNEFDVTMSFGMLHHVLDWEKAISEAVRVLRPGGHLVGYDLLETSAVRWAHRATEPGQIRTLQTGQLEHALSELPVIDIRTRRSPGGLAVRFAATKLATLASR